LKSMVASRPQRVRQEYGRFVQCCGRQKAHNVSNGVGGDFPLGGCPRIREAAL
jgi:hypothetical protein